MLRRNFIGTFAAVALFPWELLKTKAATLPFFSEEALNKCFGKAFGIEYQINRFLSLHFDCLGFLPEMMVFNYKDYRELLASHNRLHEELWGPCWDTRAVAWNFNGSQIQLRFDKKLKPGVFRTTGCAGMFYFLTPRTIEKPGSPSFLAVSGG